jgi:Ca2+-binding RTX toxin-like protein
VVRGLRRDELLELKPGLRRAHSLSGGAGRDRISGRGGSDTIRVRDGERDVGRCGDGQDGLLADRIDTIGRACERTSRTASAATASKPFRRLNFVLANIGSTVAWRFR